MHIGQAIRILRIQRKLTQEQLALEANIATSNISRIENGQRQPSQRLLLRLADSLGTTPATLYAACEELLPAGYMTTDTSDRTVHKVQRQLLTTDAQTLLKFFNELTPENKNLLLEQARLLKRWQNDPFQ